MRPKRNAPKPRALIVSLWHQSFPVPRSYQSYSIPAREDNGLLITDPNFCKTYGELLIDEAFGKMDIGDRRDLPQLFDAYAIADDIVMSDELYKFGVFVPDEDEPSMKSLQAAQGLLIKRAKLLVQEGDTKYSKPQTRAEVSDLNRWAVIQMQEQREWVYQNEVSIKVPLSRCPACGKLQEIPDPAKCWNCGMFLNLKKAVELGLTIPEHLLATVKPAPKQPAAR